MNNQDVNINRMSDNATIAISILTAVGAAAMLVKEGIRTNEFLKNHKNKKELGLT